LKKKYYPNESAQHHSVGHGDFFFKTRRPDFRMTAQHNSPGGSAPNEAIFLKTRCLPIHWDAKQKVYHGASDPRKDGMAAGY